MDTRIYVMTHKNYTKPEDELYRTLHVGKQISDDLGYDGDNIGEHISEKNKSFCELTGIYWIWKNVKCNIVGICHYRRYFVHEEDFLTKEYIEQILQNCDVIVGNSSETEYANLMEHYANRHYKKDMDQCRAIISIDYPEYIDSFDLCMESNLFTIGNMMICSKQIFDEYCEWLFDILFKLEEKIDISDYDSFQKRVFGYISERLLRVWLMNHTYRVREELVRMIDPATCHGQQRVVQLRKQAVELILKDLTKQYSIGNYINLVDDQVQKKLEGKVPVFVCWWQGYDDMPELVKVCIESIKRNLPYDIAELHFITMENVAEYVIFPEWIISKFEVGKITLTHLSDILRTALLYKYGGMWIDATYYLTQELPKEWFEKTFFTLRTKK